MTSVSNATSPAPASRRGLDDSLLSINAQPLSKAGLSFPSQYLRGTILATLYSCDLWCGTGGF